MATAHPTAANSAPSLCPTPSNASYIAPYNFPRKYSALTKPRWICFGELSIQNDPLVPRLPTALLWSLLTVNSIALFLFFAIPALGLAIDVCQRTPKVPDHFADLKPPPPATPVHIFVIATPKTVVAWTRLPIVELCITSAAIMLS